MKVKKVNSLKANEKLKSKNTIAAAMVVVMFLLRPAGGDPGHGCYVQGQCGYLLKRQRGRKCEHGTMAGYEDAMSNIFASLFLFLPSDSRKTSDCLKFSGLPSFEQYQDVPYRSKNAGSTISGLRWSPKHFVLTLLPWSFARQVVSFPMSTKFSAFYRCMLQLRAFCGCSARCRIVDGHVDLLSTVCRVGGCKPSSLSRDTLYLAKDYSSELQACFGVDVRSGLTSVHSPFTCVVCHRLLVRHSAAISQSKGRTWPCVCVSVVERWQPNAEACTLCLSLNRGERQPKKRPSAAVPLPHAISAADSCQGTGHTSSAVRPLSGDCRRSRFAHRNSKVCHHFGKAEWWWLQNCRTDLYCRCTKLRWIWWTSFSLQIAKLPVAARWTSSCVDQCLCCNAM